MRRSERGEGFVGFVLDQLEGAAEASARSKGPAKKAEPKAKVSDGA